MAENITIGAAFVGGIVAFFSPCVVILIPAFLAHLAGVTLSEQSAVSRGRVLANTFLFVLGFTFVFVALGASLGWLSSFLFDFDVWIERLGGILVVVLGLVFMGVMKFSWLGQTHRLNLSIPKKQNGFWRLLSSFLLGIIFSIGWTPCITPILAAILILASTSGSVAAGSWLLFFFSLGLMVPFFIAGFFLEWFQRAIKRHTKTMAVISKIAGAILVVFGIILILGYYQKILSLIFSL